MKQLLDCGVLGEVLVDVEYTYTPGHCATHDDPPEPCELYVTKVKVISGPLEESIVSFLETSDDFLQEVHERETIDREADRADYYNDMKREKEYDNAT